MCIVFFQINHSCIAKHKLIIAANRDEKFNRPTQPAGFLVDNPNILCGLDLQPDVKGGTWFGVNKQGKFAFLTNYLTPIDDAHTNKVSRGFIVQNFLENEMNPHQYIANTLMSREHRPHHFVGGQFTNDCQNMDVSYFGSHDSSSPLKLADGIYSLACSTLGTKWRKVDHGSNKFRNVILNSNSSTEDLMDNLFTDVLSDKTPLYPDELVKKQSGSYLPEDFLKLYCSVMVSGHTEYGTRMQTVLIVDDNNQLYFAEKTINPNAVEPNPSSYFTFPIEKRAKL
ncbi:transport and Golgi organization 2 homolog [Ciona intestinalis]